MDVYTHDFFTMSKWSHEKNIKKKNEQNLWWMDVYIHFMTDVKWSHKKYKKISKEEWEAMAQGLVSIFEVQWFL